MADLISPPQMKTRGCIFNFVIDCTDAALREYLSITPGEYVKTFTKGDLNWCLQTYLILAKRGILSVKCSNDLLEDCVNIIHSDQLLKLKGSARKFVVCVRADYPQRPWAHYHLVQNGHQVNANAVYIPHWVQPGLIKRNPKRKGVSRIAYAGAPIKGNFAGSAQKWKEMFEPHGIEFVLLPSGSWHDLSRVDVLMGLRSFSTHPYHTKPPTKLFNAWHANIPFVGGYDSAFTEVGVPGEDYLKAATAEEAVGAVLRLRENPALYSLLVNRGQQKAQLFFSEHMIAHAWERALSVAVMHRYEQWKKRPLREQVRFDVLQYAGLFEHGVKQQIKRVLNIRKAGAIMSLTNH